MIVAAALIVGAIGGVYRGVTDQPDFSEFNSEADYVWQHGHTRPDTAMFGYLPAATFLLWPFTTWTPHVVGAVLWTMVNTVAVVASAWIVYRWWLHDPPPIGMYALPLALAAPNLAHAIQSNQMTALTLVSMVAGIALVERRRQWLGGFVLGIAIIIKTLPILLVGYLVLRWKWRALVSLFVAIVALNVVPSIAYFGPRQALAEHRAWLRRAGWHSNWHLINEPFLRVHRHGTNVSLSAALTRWLREPPAATRQLILYGDPPADVVARYEAGLPPSTLLTIDPMPRAAPSDGEWPHRRIDNLSWVPRFHVANFSPRVVYGIWAVLVGSMLIALAGGTVWFTRSGRGAWPPVAALWLLAMFWPSPMMRHYYLAWALPALVVVWNALVRTAALRGGHWSAAMAIGVAGLLGWLVGDALLGSKLIRWYGIHLLAITLLVAATVWAWSRAQRECAASISE